MRPSSNAGGGLLFQKKEKTTKDQPINIPVSMRAYVKTRCKPNIDSDTRTKPCLICQDQWPSSNIEELYCGHGFCYECLHHYLNYRLTAQMQLVCPCCEKEMATDEDFWKRCNQTFKAKLVTLHDRIKDVQNAGLKLQNPNDKDPRSKIRLCRIDGCKGYVDLTASKFQCSECKKQFCFKCNLPKHDQVDCKDKYKMISEDRLDWKRCPACDVFRQTNDECTHFSCELSQEKCLVCLSGWSDKYFHHCEKEYDPLPKDIWFRESIMQSSRFISILRGILMSIFFPVFFGLILGGILVSHAVVIALAMVIAPFAVIYQGCCQEEEKLISIAFFACFPCGELVVAAIVTRQFWQNFTSNLPEYIITYLLTAKSSLYYTLPYRQNHQNYTPFTISSTCQRIIYLIIMIIMLPLLLLMVPLFFTLSAIVVFCFTLLSLPVIAYKQKSIPIWVSVIFFPIVFFHFISIDYAKFFKSLLEEVCSFYKTYCVTMCKYLTCQQPQEVDNSCLDRPAGPDSC